MPTKSPDGIYYADGTTPASLADITAAMATSIQNAFLFREMHTFSWANSTEKTAQAGMQIGDIGYQVDNLVYYRWNGSGWKIWEKAPATYVPSFGGNLTASSTSVSYSISSGRVNITGFIVNSTTTNAGGISMTLPTGFNIDTTYAYGASFFHQLGTATFVDVSPTVVYFPGFVTANNGSTVQFGRFIASTTNLTVGVVGGTQPFGSAWASGDIITFNFSYPVA